MDREQVEKTRKKSDLLCSAHANLKDKYSLWAILLDSFLLTSSALLALHILADKEMLSRFSPFGIQYETLLGSLSIIVFILSVLELRVDWKGKAQSHAKSLALYAEVKRELGYALSSNRLIKADVRRVMSKYDMAAELGSSISERDFLVQKKKHVAKIRMSKYLAERPSANIPLTRLKFFWSDNHRHDKSDSHIEN